MHRAENRRHGKMGPYGSDIMPKGDSECPKPRYSGYPLSAAGPSGNKPVADETVSPKGSSLPFVENSQSRMPGGIPLSFRLLFSLPIIGLFVLWLHPLYQAAGSMETGHLLTTLMITAAALILWGLLQLPGWLLLLLQLMTMATSWLWLASLEEKSGWLTAYPADLLRDIMLLLTGHLTDMGNVTRVLILTAGWGLLVSSVQHLALYRGSTWLFAIVTLAYLLSLDMVLGVDTSVDILFSAVLILWLQGMSELIRLREGNRSTPLPFRRWGGMTLAAACLVTAIAWGGSQLYGSRPEGVLSLQSAFDRLNDWAAGKLQERKEAIGTGVGTTGYSMNTSELGIPLTPGTEPVFTAISAEPAYWRGESLAYYDGRRWIREADAFTPRNLTGNSLNAAAEPEIRGRRMLRQQIDLAAPSPGGVPLFAASMVTNMEAGERSDGSRLGYILVNKEGDAFRLPEETGTAPVTSYTVLSALPETHPDVLRGLPPSDPGEIAAKYLELPQNLPGRVKSLAAHLTAAAGNRYDAAASVRDYLQSQFPYTLDTQVPPPGHDFVDDFLFEAKRGYCVHFATAMIVLLRSVDIPARYVQGYGPGELLQSPGPQRYVVTEGDAHAWVEVYFPGAGWIPFDPTPGGGAANAAPPASPAAASAPPSAATPAGLRAGVLPALPQPGGPAPAPLALAALAVPAAAWHWRRSLALLRAVRSRAPGRERQLRAATLAWHGLTARYGPPPPGATRREYADSLPIADAGLREAVRRFIRQWETLAYSEVSPGVATGASTVRPAGHGRTGEQKASAGEAEAFLRACLRITFRLT